MENTYFQSDSISSPNCSGRSLSDEAVGLVPIASARKTMAIFDESGQK
jgi:hypothetical protein